MILLEIFPSLQTKLAKAIAGEAQAGFMSVAPSDVLSKFVGESEASVRNIFRKALDLALQLESKCTVVFFDEIDALGQSRENRGGGEGEGCSRRVLAELLLQLNLISDPNHRLTREQEFENGNCSSENVRTRAEARVIVVAATNRVLDCDEALKRRFGIQLEVGLPNRRDRKKMIIRHMSEIEHTIVEEELEYLSLRTDSWSGSDIESLVREAAMAPVRECIRAAAHLRKRASRLEQRGGDSPVQGGCHPDEPDPDTEARSLLLHGFQTLRPVTVHDFDHGIFLFTGQNMFNPGPYDFHSSMHGREKEYYDSSSEED